MTLNFRIEPDSKIAILLADTNPKIALPELIADHREEILAELKHYGILLFRGYGCDEAEAFSKAITACALGERCSTADYKLPRTIVGQGIYTSSDLPGHIPINLHHEKPRSENPPTHIYFCSVTPAEKGGGTLFANAEDIWQAMPETIRGKVRRYGVVYKQFFHGKSLKSKLLKKILGDKLVLNWQDYFSSTDRNQVEQQLREEQKEWQWQGNNLVILHKLAGSLEHPFSHRRNWFNSADYLNYYCNNLYGELRQLSLYPYLAARYLILKDCLPMVCHYGNNEAFSAAEIAQINQLIWQHVHVHHWQKGDFMIVDNYSFMHGKEAHEGERLLYSCMTLDWSAKKEVL